MKRAEPVWRRMATVTLTDISGKTTYTATTKAGGEFVFSAIARLIYNLSVVMQGNTYKAEHPLFLNNGDSLSKNLQLSAPGAGLVFVRDPVQEPNPNASPGSGGEHLSRKEVSSLPLNSRDFSKLLLLAAGTMTDTNGAANFTQQFAVNGQRGVTGVFAMWRRHHGSRDGRCHLFDLQRRCDPGRTV